MESFAFYFDFVGCCDEIKMPPVDEIDANYLP